MIIDATVAQCVESTIIGGIRFFWMAYVERELRPEVSSEEPLVNESSETEQFSVCSGEVGASR